MHFNNYCYYLYYFIYIGEGHYFNENEKFE